MKAVEVRVEGVLATSTLQRLGCSARAAGPQTLLRIETTPSGLGELVDDCARRGRTIDSIVRVDRLRAPVGVRQQSPRS